MSCRTLMRHISDKGKKILIKAFEGLSLKPYLCPAKIWTIGYGHVIRENEVFKSVTENEADTLLNNDLLKSERSVLRLIKVPLTIGQFDSLVSFVFNLGGGSLERSTLRMKLNRGEDKLEISQEFLEWVHVNGVFVKGLFRRRSIEKNFFES